MNQYKAILLDIDNTLYDYGIAHQFAKNQVIEFCSNEFGFEKDFIEKAYEYGRNKIHLELVGTASSHNRLLYFQKMLEALGLDSLTYSMKIYNIYWNCFLAQISVFDGVYELLKQYQNQICLVTDLTAHIQYRKVERLKLHCYCNKIVTSEEAGHEKPHPYIFMMALQKLGLAVGDVCMIGDSYEKDVIGATNLGIHTIWFNHRNKKEAINSSLIQEATTMKEILELV